MILSSILDSNDPAQSTDQDCQRSFAQDLDANALQTGTTVSYAFQFLAIDYPGNPIFISGGQQFGEQIIPTNGWEWGFFLQSGAGSVIGAVISPVGPLVETTEGLQRSETNSTSFLTTYGVVSAASVFGCNFGYTNLNPPPNGTLYDNGGFGTHQQQITLQGTFYFAPGTWQVQLDAFYSNGGMRVVPQGSITIAGVLVTSYTATTIVNNAYTGGGFSILGGATHGTTNFVVPPGGGYASLTLSDYTDGTTLTAIFTFLHA